MDFWCGDTLYLGAAIVSVIHKLKKSWFSHIEGRLGIREQNNIVSLYCMCLFLPLYVWFSVGTDTPEPLHEVCGTRSFFYNFPWTVSSECLRPIWRSKASSQWNCHGSPQTNIQSKNNTIFMDRNANHEMGSR